MTQADKPPSKSPFLSKVLTLINRILPTARVSNKAEILDTLRQAEHDGIMAQDAYAMMQRVLYVSDLKVRDVMIPRSQVTMINREDTLEDCLHAMVESGHSRFPVIDDERDQIVGILLAKDFLSYFEEENQRRFNLRDLIRPVVFVPESKRLNVLLTDFRKNRNHMAVVVDEFSNIAGLVTIEDVLEQIVGEIEDEHDTEEEESMVRVLSETETIVKALLPIDEFNEYFKSYLHDNGSDTIGGLISQRLGHVPQPGETIEIDAMSFEILHADNRQVHLIRVSKQEADCADG